MKKLEWTKELPTEPGWYWQLNESGVRVVECIWAHHTEMMVSYGYPLSRYVNHQWCGPIRPPGEEVDAFEVVEHELRDLNIDLMAYRPDGRLAMAIKFGRNDILGNLKAFIESVRNLRQVDENKAENLR